MKLTTDDGISGYGEVYSVPFHPRVVAQLIEDVVARNVIGAAPFHIERLWRVIYSSGYTQRPDTSILGILSGIEMACWDIVGKAVGKPTYELLGGRVYERLRSYTYIYSNCSAFFAPPSPSAFDPRQLSLEALDLSEKFVRLMREAVGSKCDLLFGTHGQMTPAGALRLAKRLEPYDPLWLEYPVYETGTGRRIERGSGRSAITR